VTQEPGKLWGTCKATIQKRMSRTMSDTSGVTLLTQMSYGTNPGEATYAEVFSAAGGLGAPGFTIFGLATSSPPGCWR
jgi:hypothetical protein